MVRRTQQLSKRIEWKRADPEALAKFDPRTKECTMNCGPHQDDPRSEVERQFLCEDCVTRTPGYIEALEAHQERVKLRLMQASGFAALLSEALNHVRDEDLRDRIQHALNDNERYLKNA